MKKAIALMLSLLLLASVITVAFALDSATGDAEYKVIVIYETKDPWSEGPFTVKEGDNYTLIVKTVDGYEFDKIKVEGEYELISQDGSTYVLKPKESLVIHVLFKDVTPTPKPEDDNPVSPGTGLNPTLVAVAAMFAICGVVVCTRKLLKNH